MTPKIYLQLNTFLQGEEALEIIKSVEFYFQKAQDTLTAFLEYKINETQKNYFVNNLKEYEELKQHLEDSIELQEFGKLLFSIVAYCDLKSYRKNELNRYYDKRVLAQANVRMNNWVEQLLRYKFYQQISEGSVKNAIDYLINPDDNFTMLSENHRAQISENLLKKKYNKASFKNDIFSFYSDLIPSLANTINLSHLLSRFCYQIASEWKLNVIGLISPDKTGWQEDAIEIVQDGSYIALWNHKKPNGVNDTLKQLRQCIDDHGYFRIFYTSTYKVHYVAEIIDFITMQTELDDVKWRNKFGNVKWYSDKLTEYKDDKKSASWVYLAKRIYKVEDGSLTDYKFYKGNSYPSVGGQSPIISINSALELKNQKQMEDKVNLLKYKKQIILQGPPGTGKTRLAKEIAKQVIQDKLLKNVSWLELERAFTNGQRIKGRDEIFYTIKEVRNESVLLSVSSSSDLEIPFSDIMSNYNLQTLENIDLKTEFNPKILLTKILYDKYNHNLLLSVDSEQIKLLQFHPSYTYEDFVRGISAESNGASIEYKNVNRALGLFAKGALLNFLDSKKTISRLKSDLTFNEKFNSFKTLVINSLAEGKYFNIPNTTAQIIDVDDIQFRYTFSANPGYNYSVLFSDFFKLYELGGDFKTSSDITRLESNLTRRSVGTYYFHLYKLIDSQLKTIEDIEVPPLKNYVLILDEINRANLSSVLGELIYALEYRGEAVESMYAIDGDNKLTLPPNLYIIGTMNTADRSVGHIDYAIRRRFAFVDVLPKDLTKDDGIVFNDSMFKQVTNLFVKNYDPEIDYSNDVIIEKSIHLTGDFEPKDVWLGHSYFIQQYEKDEKGNDDLSKPIDFSLRIKYEIKPILEEYIKDGILKETAREIIKNLA